MLRLVELSGLVGLISQIPSVMDAPENWENWSIPAMCLFIVLFTLGLDAYKARQSAKSHEGSSRSLDNLADKIGKMAVEMAVTNQAYIETSHLAAETNSKLSSLVTQQATTNERLMGLKEEQKGTNDRLDKRPCIAPQSK